MTMQVKRVIESVKDFPGLGKQIKAARVADERSLVQICREAEISRPYWYQIEEEKLVAPASEEMIRKIERVLGIDLGVSFGEEGSQ